MIFLATLSFPLALQVFNDEPEQPGRRCRQPYVIGEDQPDGETRRGRSWKSLTAGRGSASSSRRWESASRSASRPRRPARRQARAAALRRLRGLGRLRQGRRDQAARRAARPAPRPRRPVRRAERATRSAITSSGASGRALPGWGGMAVFDRSWYGRVLVERVEGSRRASSGCAPTTRSTASSALADRGHGPGEALAAHLARGAAEALQEREKTPLKAWKLTDEDWRNREKRDEYKVAVEDMVARTDTPNAPWYRRRGRVEALRAGARGRDRDRADRGRHARRRDRAARRIRGRRRRELNLPGKQPEPRDRRGEGQTA